MTPLSASLSAGEKRNLLPDLVREIGGQGFDVGDRFEHNPVGTVLRTERRGLRRQARRLRAVVEVVVQLVGVEAVLDALCGRACTFGLVCSGSLES